MKYLVLLCAVALLAGCDVLHEETYVTSDDARAGDAMCAGLGGLSQVTAVRWFKGKEVRSLSLRAVCKDGSIVVRRDS